MGSLLRYNVFAKISALVDYIPIKDERLCGPIPCERSFKLQLKMYWGLLDWSVGIGPYNSPSSRIILKFNISRLTQSMGISRRRLSKCILRSHTFLDHTLFSSVLTIVSVSIIVVKCMTAFFISPEKSLFAEKLNFCQSWNEKKFNPQSNRKEKNKLTATQCTIARFKKSSKIQKLRKFTDVHVYWCTKCTRFQIISDSEKCTLPPSLRVILPPYKESRKTLRVTFS